MPGGEANQQNSAPSGKAASRRGKNIIAKTRATHFLEFIGKGAAWQKMSIERSQIQVELLKKGRELIADLSTRQRSNAVTGPTVVTRDRSKVVTGPVDLLAAELAADQFLQQCRSKFNDLSDQKVHTAILAARDSGNQPATDKSSFWLDNLVMPDNITDVHKAIICNLLEAEYKQRRPHSTAKLKLAMGNNGLQILGTIFAVVGLFEQTAEATSVLNISAGFIKPLAESLGASSVLAGTAVISPFSMVGAAFYFSLVCISVLNCIRERSIIRDKQDKLQKCIQSIEHKLQPGQSPPSTSNDYTARIEAIKTRIEKNTNYNAELEENASYNAELEENANYNAELEENANYNAQLDEIIELQSSISKHQIMLRYSKADLATNTTIFCTILAVSLLSALLMTGAAMTGPVSLPLISIIVIGVVGVSMTYKNFENIKRKHDAVITEQVCNQTFTPDRFFSQAELESVVAMSKEFDKLSMKDRYVADVNNIRKAVNDFIIAKPADKEAMKRKIKKCIQAKHSHGSRSWVNLQNFEPVLALLDQENPDNYQLLTATFNAILNDQVIMNKSTEFSRVKSIFDKKLTEVVCKLSQAESSSIDVMTEKLNVMTEKLNTLSKTNNSISGLNDIREAVNNFIIFVKPSDKDKAKEAKLEIQKKINAYIAKKTDGTLPQNQQDQFDELKDLLNSDTPDNRKILTATLAVILYDIKFTNTDKELQSKTITDPHTDLDLISVIDSVNKGLETYTATTSSDTQKKPPEPVLAVQSLIPPTSLVATTTDTEKKQPVKPLAMPNRANRLSGDLKESKENINNTIEHLKSAQDTLKDRKGDTSYEHRGTFKL